MDFYNILRLTLLYLLVILPGLFNKVEGTTVWKTTVFTQSNCTLMPERKHQESLLENIIEQDNRLITLEVNLHWTLQPENSSYLKKASWYMTTDSTGRRLLLLDDHYASMSLQTLSYGTANVQISFIQEPADCLANFTANDIEKSLMFSLLTLPKDSKSMNDDDISILHICTGSVNSDGSCCNLTLNGEYIRCDKLHNDSMLLTLELIFYIITIVVLSHCPYLIPKSFYKTGSDNNRNSYRVLNTALGLSIRAVSEHSNENDDHMQGIITREIDGIFDAVAEDINGEQFAFSNDRQSEENNCYYKDSLREGICLESITIGDALFSELQYSKGLFHNLRRTLKNIFSRCLIKDSNKYFRRFCYGKPCSDWFGIIEWGWGRNLFCFQCLQITLWRLAYVLLCIIHVLIRIYLYHSHDLSDWSLNLLPFCMLPTILIPQIFKDNKLKTLANVTEGVLKNRLERKANKCFSVLLPPCTFRAFRFNSYIWLILTFPISLIYFCYLSLPLLNLSFEIYSLIKKERNAKKSRIYIAFIIFFFF